MNEPIDKPAEESSGSSRRFPRSSASTATGVTGLIAIAQHLDDPWRTALSVAGPWMVVFGRWLVNRLEPAFHLVEWEVYLRLIRCFVKDKTQIETIEAEIQELRLLLLGQIRDKIRRPRQESTDKADDPPGSDSAPPGVS